MILLFLFFNRFPCSPRNHLPRLSPPLCHAHFPAAWPLQVPGLHKHFHPPCSLGGALPSADGRQRACTGTRTRAHVHTHCAFWEDRFGALSPWLSLACSPATWRVSLCPAQSSELAGREVEDRTDPGLPGVPPGGAWQGAPAARLPPASCRLCGSPRRLCQEAPQTGPHNGNVFLTVRRLEVQDQNGSRRFSLSPLSWAWHGRLVACPQGRPSVRVCVLIASSCEDTRQTELGLRLNPM